MSRGAVNKVEQGTNKDIKAPSKYDRKDIYVVQIMAQVFTMFLAAITVKTASIFVVTTEHKINCSQTEYYISFARLIPLFPFFLLPKSSPIWQMEAHTNRLTFSISTALLNKAAATEKIKATASK